MFSILLFINYVLWCFLDSYCDNTPEAALTVSATSMLWPYTIKKKVIKCNYVAFSPLKPHQRIEGGSTPGLKFNFFKCFTAHVGFNLCTLRGLVFCFLFWLLIFMGLMACSCCPAVLAATALLLTHSWRYWEGFRVLIPITGVNGPLMAQAWILCVVLGTTR